MASCCYYHLSWSELVKFQSWVEMGDKDTGTPGSQAWAGIPPGFCASVSGPLHKPASHPKRHTHISVLLSPNHGKLPSCMQR